jgi:D-ribose pyranose/furanose isomerase RbsD
MNDELKNPLEEKINRIIVIAEEYKQHNQDLSKQVEALSELIRKKDQEIEVLETKYQTLKNAKTFVMTAGNTKEAKLRINSIVREIDRCIALLNI